MDSESSSDEEEEEEDEETRRRRGRSSERDGSEEGPEGWGAELLSPRDVFLLGRVLGEETAGEYPFSMVKFPPETFVKPVAAVTAAEEEAAAQESSSEEEPGDSQDGTLVSRPSSQPTGNESGNDDGSDGGVRPVRHLRVTRSRLKAVRGERKVPAKTRDSSSASSSSSEGDDSESDASGAEKFASVSKKADRKPPARATRLRGSPPPKPPAALAEPADMDVDDDAVDPAEAAADKDDTEKGGTTDAGTAHKDADDKSSAPVDTEDAPQQPEVLSAEKPAEAVAKQREPAESKDPGDGGAKALGKESAGEIAGAGRSEADTAAAAAPADAPEGSAETTPVREVPKEVGLAEKEEAGSAEMISGSAEGNAEEKSPEGEKLEEPVVLSAEEAAAAAEAAAVRLAAEERKADLARVAVQRKAAAVARAKATAEAKAAREAAAAASAKAAAEAQAAATAKAQVGDMHFFGVAIYFPVLTKSTGSCYASG